MFPPFAGFPLEGVGFLRKLKKNNNRQWFQNHKPEYDEYVKLPMQSLIASMSEPMASLAPEIHIDSKRNMFRIYRDTRFSKDKRPYKTNAAAVFHPKGHWGNSAGYYLSIETDGIYAGGGIYMPSGDHPKRIRHAIGDNPKEFLSIVTNETFVRKFKTLEGEKLRRMPLGFPAGHRMGDWLKYKSFYTGVEWEESVCHTAKFVDRLMQVYKDLLPLVRFLNRAVTRG